jgi:cob(I)alamin adenosyltransferase
MKRRGEGVLQERTFMKLKQGYLQIYTGDGKGKTTAAAGLALRALGAGFKVCMIQFLKKRPSSELLWLAKCPGFKLRRFGRETWARPPFQLRDRRLAQAGLAALEAELLNRGFDCIIADELCTALSLGLVAEREVLACLAQRPPRLELVITGRGATPALKKLADLVTEMKAVKHYFARGVAARRGIEY